MGRTVCEEWSYTPEGYQNFKSWFLAELAKLGITLDEFNSMNCRLANMRQQQRNQSRSRKYLGKHILDYADELGFSYRKACKCYYSGTFAQLLAQYGVDL